MLLFLLSILGLGIFEIALLALFLIILIILLYSFFFKRSGDDINEFLIDSLMNEQDQYIAFFDSSFKVILANKSFEELIGISREELTAQPFKELAIARDLIQAFVKNNDKIEEGKSSSIIYSPYFLRNKERQWLQVQKRSLKFKKSGPSYILVIASDVSDRKFIEERLSETQNEYKQLVESAQDIIFRIDLEGNFTFVNSIVTKITEYSEEEFTELNFWDIVDEEDRVKVRTFYRDQVKRGLDSSYLEFKGRTKSGKLIWFGQTITSIKDYGVTLGFQSVTRDITVKKEAERQLLQNKELAEEASLAKSNFISSMSHELRTPLNAILGYSQILEKSESLTSVEKEHISAMAKGGEELLSMVNDILELSKLDSEQTTLTTLPTELKSFFESFLAKYERDASDKGLKFSIQMSENFPQKVKVDLEKVSSILKNLLSNALKFTSKGEITFLLATEDASAIGKSDGAVIKMSVKDTGIGISKTKQEFIFQPFWQDDSIKYNGTGLGLTLCKRLAVFLGGDISIESEEGKGTVVDVFIPIEILDDKHELNEVTEVVKKEVGLSKNVKILIVDDLEPNRIITRIILQENGFDFDEAVDGQDALKKLVEFQPDVILMDINMPVMNGKEAMVAIRAMDSNVKDIPIIVVTAGGFKESKAEFIASGFSDYLQKPFKEEELIASIHNQLPNADVHQNSEGEIDEAKEVTVEEVAEFIFQLNTENKMVVKNTLLVQDLDAISNFQETLKLRGDTDNPNLLRLIKAAKDFDYAFIVKTLKILREIAKKAK